MNAVTKGNDSSEITPAEHRRRVVRRSLDALMHSHPQLYYQSTAEVARAVHEGIGNASRLSVEGRAAVKRLSPRGIEVILAFR